MKEKPVVVMDYNQFMLGVDKLDQLVSYYSFTHRSLKWWKKVFFWFLEFAVVNSYIIYMKKCSKNKVQAMAHLTYLRSLSLLPPAAQHEGPNVDNHPLWNGFKEIHIF